MSHSDSPSSPAPLPTTINADGVAVITIEPNQGPMVILDLALIQRLERTFKDLLNGPALRGLVLASGSPRVFIAGADLKSIDALGHDELDRYLAYGQEVFGLLCRFSCATCAAINGAALGGGLEIAMHCDGLVASPPVPGKDGTIKPYLIGLPEAGLSICPGWGGTNLLPARMDASEAIRRTCTGRAMGVDQAVKYHLVDEMCAAPEGLIASAAAWTLANAHYAGARRDGLPSRWIGRADARNRVTLSYTSVHDECAMTDPGRACLKAVATGLEDGWSAALRVEREELNRLRAAPAGKAAIGAFLKK
jgi:enoyl-CoA hydratase/carnithine racemase